MDGKYYKSKQSTLVPAMGIRGGMCVDNESCTKARGRDGKKKVQTEYPGVVSGDKGWEVR